MLQEAEFRALVAALDRTGQWPDAPGRGALNFLTPKATLAGLRTVTEGTVISCADRQAARNTLATDQDVAPLTTSMDAAHDWLAVNEEIRYQQHGWASMTHMDSLGHFFYENRGYGGTSTAVVSGDGVTANDIVPAGGGAVGRGLLLDLPRMTSNEPYVPVDRVVTLAEVQRWLVATGTTPQSGDILFVRTGRPNRRRRSPEPSSRSALSIWNVPGGSTTRVLSLVLSDAGLDSPNPLVQNVSTPWHILTLVAMGIFLIDCADLEELASACDDHRRNSFLAVVAALPLPGPQRHRSTLSQFCEAQAPPVSAGVEQPRTVISPPRTYRSPPFMSLTLPVAP